jgi:hypothetical protein
MAKHQVTISRTGAGWFVSTAWGGRTLSTLREAAAFKREAEASKDQLRSVYLKEPANLSVTPRSERALIAECRRRGLLRDEGGQ